MVCVLVVGRVLSHVDSRKPCHGKRQRIRAGLHSVIHVRRAKIGKRIRKWLKHGNKILTSAQMKSLRWPLSSINHQAAEMVLYFRLMLLHVSKRPVEPFFFSGEKDKANRAPRALARAHDG